MIYVQMVPQYMSHIIMRIVEPIDSVLMVTSYRNSSNSVVVISASHPEPEVFRIARRLCVSGARAL